MPKWAPGHELGEADPETVEGLVEWLRTLRGDSATEAEQYAAILGADGVTCLRDLILNESEMIAIHIPRVIARRINFARVGMRCLGYRVGTSRRLPNR